MDFGTQLLFSCKSLNGNSFVLSRRDPLKDSARKREWPRFETCMKWIIAVIALSLFANAQVPRSQDVWIITEENHSYEDVIGNPQMPYFNSLASQYALTENYYSPQHNSLTALMWLVAGQQVTLDNSTMGCFTVNNLVRQLLSKGYTWRAYQEDLPYAGFQGLYAGHYVRRHNPLIDFK